MKPQLKSVWCYQEQRKKNCTDKCFQQPSSQNLFAKALSPSPWCFIADTSLSGFCFANKFCLVHTHTTALTPQLYSHPWVPPGQDPGTNYASDKASHPTMSPLSLHPFFFFFLTISFNTLPPWSYVSSVLWYCTLASRPIWSSDRLLLVRPGVVVGSPPSPSTPGQTLRSCIPCLNILE